MCSIMAGRSLALARWRWKLASRLWLISFLTSVPFLTKRSFHCWLFVAGCSWAGDTSAQTQGFCYFASDAFQQTPASGKQALGSCNKGWQGGLSLNNLVTVKKGFLLWSVMWCLFVCCSEGKERKGNKGGNKKDQKRWIQKEERQRQKEERQEKQKEDRAEEWQGEKSSQWYWLWTCKESLFCEEPGLIGISISCAILLMR